MKKRSNVKIQFRLYITPNAPQSLLSIMNIKRICEKHLPDRYDLKIIDICENSPWMKMDQILLSPTLVRVSQEGTRKIIGNLNNENEVLKELHFI
jgi:circadian clock protein KaiB